MTQARPIARPKTRVWLPSAFLVIIATFMVGNLVALFLDRKTQDKDRTIARNAMVSIEEVGRIIRDIDQERLLVDAHIFQSEPEQMEGIEQRISQVETDMMKAAGEYEPLSTFPGEHAVWEDLWREAGNLRPSLQRVIQLSRANQDLQAFAAMESLTTSFEAIDRQADSLIGVNRRAADDAVHQIELFQRRILFLLGSITLAIIAFASFLAWKVTRLLSRQDGQIVHSAELLEVKTSCVRHCGISVRTALSTAVPGSSSRSIFEAVWQRRSMNSAFPTMELEFAPMTSHAYSNLFSGLRKSGLSPEPGLAFLSSNESSTRAKERFPSTLKRAAERHSLSV